MKLKIKNFNWLAGRPVVFLNNETANKLNVHVDERVCLKDGRKTFAVVDIFDKVVKTGEIGLSNEVSRIMNLKDNHLVDVYPSELSEAARLIKKKLAGQSLSKQEISLLISEIVQNDLTESEIAYFIAAEKTKGMSMREIISLTEAMIQSGSRIKFNKKIVADKHCIGGIAGNRTTPIAVSICAAAGLFLPKTSSVAITSASGTADVIETISRIEFSAQELKKIVEKANASLAWGGSLKLAPSDDKIIHVERLLNLDVEPQLLASIMSKKIAAGSNHILIDIPFGKGAKFSNKSEAKSLGKKFELLAHHFKVKVKCVYTDGSQPIGNGIGPVLEMLDVISVLKNDLDAPQDLKEKALFLASQLMELCNIKDSKLMAREILESGKAYEKFKEIINLQNQRQKDSNDFNQRIKKLKPAKFKKTIYATFSGKIKKIDNKKINSLCRVLGTPESKTSGVYLHKHVGKVVKKEPLITLYCESKYKLQEALRYYKEFQPMIIKRALF